MAPRAKPVLSFSPEHPAIEEVMSAKDIAGLIGLLNAAPDPRNLEAVERALNSVMQEYLETKAQRHEYVFLETEDGRGAVGLGRPAPTHAEVNATLDVFLKALHKLRGILAEHPSLDLTVRQDESWPSGGRVPGRGVAE